MRRRLTVLVTFLLIAVGYAAAVLFFISLAVMAKRGDRAQEAQLRLAYPPSQAERKSRMNPRFRRSTRGETLGVREPRSRVHELAGQGRSQRRS
jgi:hypothetical protein